MEEVKHADIALLDATFYKAEELSGRKMEEVPHPLVGETAALFRNEPTETKNKIYLIHLNHTNPLIWDTSELRRFEGAGFRVARQGSRL